MPMSYADSYMPYSDPVCLRGEAFTTLGSQDWKNQRVNVRIRRSSISFRGDKLSVNSFSVLEPCILGANSVLSFRGILNYSTVELDSFP